MQKHGPWTVEASHERYHNSFIRVLEDQVIQPDGEPGSYATVRVPRGVAILAIDQQHTVYLTQQFRYALGQISIEVVSGALEEDESPLAAAQREAREEMGIEAETWTELGMVNLDTSIVQSPVYLFLAQNLNFVESDREGTETIEPIKTSLAEAVQQVIQSEITHSASCVLILKAAHLLNRSITSEF
jgi:hypothetical protein